MSLLSIKTGLNFMDALSKSVCQTDCTSLQAQSCGYLQGWK